MRPGYESFGLSGRLFWVVRLGLAVTKLKCNPHFLSGYRAQAVVGKKGHAGTSQREGYSIYDIEHKSQGGTDFKCLYEPLDQHNGRPLAYDDVLRRYISSPS